MQLALPALLGLTLAARPLEAQRQPPIIGIDHGPVSSNGSVSITIGYCAPVDEENPILKNSLGSTSRHVWVNGTEVTSSFSYGSRSVPGCSSAAESNGGATLQEGTNTVTAQITGSGGTTTESIQITYTAPPTRVAATITMASNPGDYRDPSRCAAECFETVLNYALPAYVSKDADRTTGLVYRSGRARPVGVVSLAITDPSPDRAQRYSLKLKHPNGSWVTFLNGSNELFFEYYWGATMVGQFDVSAEPTGRYQYTAYVTSYWDGGTPITASAPAPVIVVNGKDSPYGAGVEVTELQRAYRQPDGVLITTGTGAASFFAGCTWVGCVANGPAGDFSTLTVNADNTLWRRYPDGTTVAFSESGYELAVWDRFNNRSSYDYNADLTLRAITDPAGATYHFGYRGGDWQGWKGGTLEVIYQNVGTGRQAQFGVDLSNHLTQIYDADGASVWRATYDGLHHVTEFAGPGGSAWSYGYAADGTVARVRSPLTHMGSGIYDTLVTQFVAPNSRIVTAIQQGAGLPGNPVPTALDRRAAITDPRGMTTYLDVNRFGAASRTYSPDGQQPWTEYDNATGLPTRSYAGDQTQQVYYTWDGPRLITQSAGSSSVSYEYDGPYDDVKRIFGNVPEQRFYYDETKPGRPLSYTVMVATGDTTRYTFSTDGRLTSVIDPKGHGSTATYEPGGLQNLVETRALTAVGERKTSFGRDGFGRVTSMRDPAGALTQTDYDALNRPSRNIGARNDVTTMEYDGNRNLVKVTDARGLTRGYGRNVLGWMTHEQDPAGNVQWFTYDRGGNLTQRTDRNGWTLYFAYDSLGRVTRRYQNKEDASTTYGYDPAGLWTAVTNAAGTDTVWVDAQRRVTRQYTWRNAGGYSRTIRQSNDFYTGAPTGLNILGNSAQVDSITFGYNSLMQLDKITPPQAGTTTIGYNADHLPSTIAYPGGLVRTNEYSTLHALTGISYNLSSVNSAFQRFYEQDMDGRIASSTAAGGKIRRFGYDLEGELTSRQDFQTGPRTCYWTIDKERVCEPGEETYTGGGSYDYDAVGNPVGAGISVGGPNRVYAAGGDSLVYDAEGNLVRRYRAGSPWTFDNWYWWNSLGQLARVETTRNGTYGDVYFTYDGSGRRISKLNATTGTRTDYLWDGWQMIAELDPQGASRMTYTYFPGTDNLHSVTNWGAPYQNWGFTYYAATDGAGNVEGLVRGSDNAVVSRYAYAPFGVLEQNDDGGVGNALRFKGVPFDAETGLYYMRARYYAPDLARFISEDPIGVEGGINQYAFAGNDPVNRSDPTGLIGCVSWHWDMEVISEDWVIYTKVCDVWELERVVITAKADKPFSDNFLNPCKRGGTCGESALAFARALEDRGFQYKLGTNGNGAYDCSSYCSALLAHQGCSVPGRLTTGTMAGNKSFTSISADEAGPGDIIVNPGNPYGHMGEIVGRTGSDWMVSDWGRRMNKKGSVISYWGPGQKARHWFPGHLSSFRYYRPKCG